MSSVNVALVSSQTDILLDGDSAFWFVCFLISVVYCKTAILLLLYIFTVFHILFYLLHQQYFKRTFLHEVFISQRSKYWDINTMQAEEKRSKPSVDLAALEPTARVKQLANYGAVVDVDPNVPPRR